jgi:hypothetical protein
MSAKIRSSWRVFGDSRSSASRPSRYEVVDGERAAGGHLHLAAVLALESSGRAFAASVAVRNPRRVNCSRRPVIAPEGDLEVPLTTLVLPAALSAHTPAMLRAHGPAALGDDGSSLPRSDPRAEGALRRPVIDRGVRIE